VRSSKSEQTATFHALKTKSVKVYRKNLNQVKMLIKLFKDPNVEMTDQFKEEAVKKTGLKWCKIYKWWFDRRKKNQLE